MNKIFFTLFVLISYAFHGIAREDSTVFYLTQNKKGIIVDKYKKKALTWTFNNSDSLQFADPLYDDSRWLKLKSKISAEKAEKNNIKNRYSWFRLKVKADSTVINKAFALRFEGFGILYAYQDGILLDSIADEEDGKKISKNFKNQGIFTYLTDTNMHVWSIRYYSSLEEETIEDTWGFQFYIDSPKEILSDIKGRFLFSTYLIMSFGYMFATLFLVHFILFIFYHKDLSNLYFALFNLSFFVSIFCLNYVSLGEYGARNKIAITVYSTMIIAFFSLTSFASYLFSKNKIIIRCLAVFCILLLMYFLMVGDDGVSGYATSALTAFAMLYTVFLFIRAMIKKLPGSQILGVGVLITISFILLVFIQGTFFGGVNFTINSEESNFFEYFKIAYLFLAVMSAPLSITSYLAWRFSSTAKNLNKQLLAVEVLSAEKQSILENQNAELERQVAVRTQEVTEQKQRSDNLLLNILPEEVAEELKLKGESKAHRYDRVSVLFTDFVNFTKISEQLGVEELLHELNINFTAFDRIMEKHGLEKIKTIGDAYLAVCGLPVADKHHAENTVKAALDILAFVQKRKQEVPYGLDIRIGINSGSLIAGIIGVKKFAYDIWGDTVNIAARMEQHGEAGKINISENTFDLVKDDFVCVHRGMLEAKGKGEMNMYFVEEKA
jgi:adenylate cyclase